MPVIPVSRKQRQEDLKFKISLGHIVGPYLKKIKEGLTRPRSSLGQYRQLTVAGGGAHTAPPFMWSQWQLMVAGGGQDLFL